MKANVSRSVNKLGIEEVERPRACAGEAIIRVTLTRDGVIRVAIRP